jgi:hypothetical protein
MNNIESIYITTTKNFNKILSRIEFDIERSKFPYSITAILRFSKKIDYLLDTIKSSKVSYYVSQILTRVLFEHYLVSHYIWTKLRLEENDDCGKAFYMNYFVSEWFKKEHYNLQIENIIDKKKEKNYIQRLRIKYPELKDLEQTDLDDINKISKQFDIKKIGEYLKNNTPEGDPYAKAHSAMLEFLDMYNKLSTFVHGGPSAERFTFEKKDTIDYIRICNENIQWGMIASSQTKQNLMISLNSEFHEPYSTYVIDLFKKN